MSKATKRKYVTKEVEDLAMPTETQSIVRIIDSRGNNLHEIVDPSGEKYLVSMPTKFRRNIWVKRGDFVLVEPIPEGDKVKAEIVKILTREHQRWYRAQSCWPCEFDENSNLTLGITKNGEKGAESEEEGLFVNTNRVTHNRDATASETDSSSDESQSD